MGFEETLKFLINNPDSTTVWLAHFLGHVSGQKGEAQDFPHISIGHDYLGPNPEASYLISNLSYGHASAKEKTKEEIIKVEHRITEAVSSILSEVLNNEKNTPEVEGTGARQIHNIWLFDNLLCLIEGLPSSGTTKRKLLTITTQMHENKGYKEWKTTNVDVYDQLVRAMVSLVDENEDLGKWEKRLAQDLASTDYTVAALSVLLAINASEAIRCHLCDTIKILGSAGASPANLMFGLAYMTRDKPKLRELILLMLGESNLDDAIREFNRSVDALKT